MLLGPRLVCAVLILSTASAGMKGEGFDFDHWYKCFLANNALMWLIKLVPKTWEKKIMRWVRMSESWMMRNLKKLTIKIRDCMISCCRGIMSVMRGKEYPPILDV